MNDNIEIIDISFDNKDNNKSIVNLYGENLTNKKYLTNPAIAREEEIKKLIVVLLTPDKSAILVGKAGIGKTAIVEGLAYKIQCGDVPEVLKNYQIIKMNSSSLTGTIERYGREEPVISVLVDELKQMSKTILFIDEIHTLMGSSADGPMDLANILKPGLDRGDIKAIGATTTIEYETYVVRDRAFLRRFEKIDVTEPDEATTVKILMESLPRIEAQTGIKFKYNNYVENMLLESIVSATSEYKRIYGLSAMYPDVAFSVLSQAFSLALFENKKEVDITDVYNAIKTSKRIYRDSIVKELTSFRLKFKKFCDEQGVTLPIVTIADVQRPDEIL